MTSLYYLTGTAPSRGSDGLWGIYSFRSIAKHLFVRLSLIPILLYSSFILGSFRQDSILYQFAWIPYIAYFLLRIVYHKDYRWHNWFVLAGLIGLNWQSYFFAGTWVFLLFFLWAWYFFGETCCLNFSRIGPLYLNLE